MSDEYESLADTVEQRVASGDWKCSNDDARLIANALRARGRLTTILRYAETAAVNMAGQIVPSSVEPRWVSAALDGGESWTALERFFDSAPRTAVAKLYYARDRGGLKFEDAFGDDIFCQLLAEAHEQDEKRS